MKITKITNDQRARFPEWVEKWIQLGLSTEPADFDRATAAALRAYELCNLGRPSVVLRMGSPYSATLGGILAWGFLRAFAKEGVGSQVWSQVRSQVESQVWSQVGSQVGSQVWSQVRSQVRSQVWSQVRSELESEVGSQVRGQVGSGIYNDRGGAFWAAWCAYVAYLRDVLGWDDPVLERFRVDEDLATSCGWAWWHENVLAISDRPSEIHRDTEGRLHNPSGPSIVYRDGWALHHVNGVAVPADVIEQPDSLTVDRIDGEQNTEVRRVMVDRYGAGRYLENAGAQEIDRSRFGTLYRREMGDDEPLVMVRVRNSTPEPDGSIKDYFLRVPPEMRTAIEAVAWTFDVSAAEYRPSIET